MPGEPLHPAKSHVEYVDPAVLSQYLSLIFIGFLVVNPSPSLNPTPHTLNPKPLTLNPKPLTLNPKPLTLNH